MIFGLSCYNITMPHHFRHLFLLCLEHTDPFCPRLWWNGFWKLPSLFHPHSNRPNASYVLIWRLCICWSGNLQLRWALVCQCWSHIGIGLVGDGSSQVAECKKENLLTDPIPYWFGPSFWSSLSWWAWLFHVDGRVCHGRCALCTCCTNHEDVCYRWH